MTQMKTVRTAELIGAALDWAVGIAVGEHITRIVGDHPHVLINGQIAGRYLPSTDWSQGGALLDQHCKGFGLIQDGKATTWRAFGYSRHAFDSERLQRMASGTSILVAACRAIVAANLGDAVQIPAELLP
jgi:hypothetical protein